MNQNYKFKSLQIGQQVNKEIKQDNNINSSHFYTVDETRTIDFELLDGTRQCFPYSHMLTAWLGREEARRVIKIFFATHLVTIEGYCLEEIYKPFIEQRLKSVKAIDMRYMKAKSEGSLFVSNIEISWKNETPEQKGDLF